MKRRDHTVLVPHDAGHSFNETLTSALQIFIGSARGVGELCAAPHPSAAVARYRRAAPVDDVGLERLTERPSRKLLLSHVEDVRFWSGAVSGLIEGERQ